MKGSYTYRKRRYFSLRSKAIVSVIPLYVVLSFYFLYFTFVDQHHNVFLGITVAAVTVFAGILLIYFLARQMQDALKNMIETTGQIARGDLSQRLNINTGDELEELGVSFNQMAEALAEREKALMIARNTMDSIFNVISAGIAYISRDYEIIHANRAFEDILMYETGSPVKGLKCYELLRQSEYVCKDCPGRSAMSTGKSYNIVKEIILSNGDHRLLRVHAYPMQDTGNGPAGFVEYIMDITQQRKLEEELKTYTEHLQDIVQERTRRLEEAQVQIVHQEKMAALGQMAAGVAHEIGNPLSALSSLVRALEINVSNNSPDGKTRVMKEQIDRISRIVRDMMDFSRPASYGKSLTHVNQVIRSALGIASYDRRLKGIHVITSLDNEIPALKLDGDRLLQVFLNIIFNAAEAMNGEGTLTVMSSLEKDSVHMVFEDTGTGIPDDLLSRVFEPFFTTKDMGTGLGLSVSYGIMQNMGGLIRVSNRKGRGTAFTVEVPMGVMMSKTR